MRILFACVLLLAFATLTAQVPGPVLSPVLSFDVASVKVDKEQTRSPMVWQPGGRFTMSLPIQSLVSIGYQVPLYRIVGAPDWMRTVFFDISAHAGRQVAVEERPSFYRGLLADRFGMVAHVEQREMPAYALVLARNDGRLGPGLRRSEINCDAVIAERRRRAEAGQLPDPVAPGQRPICGAVGGPANLLAGAVNINIVIGLLSSGLERPVLDRTGLTGSYDIDFRSAPMRVADAERVRSDLPSVFTALQEQLGLKLEPITTAIPVLVIDRLEMPNEN